MFFRQFENASHLWLDISHGRILPTSLLTSAPHLPHPHTLSPFKVTFHTCSFLLSPPASPHPSLISTGDFVSHFTDEVRTLWREWLCPFRAHTTNPSRRPSRFQISFLLNQHTHPCPRPALLALDSISSHLLKGIPLKWIFSSLHHSFFLFPGSAPSARADRNTFSLKKCALELTSVCSYHSFLLPFIIDLSKE